MGQATSKSLAHFRRGIKNNRDDSTDIRYRHQDYVPLFFTSPYSTKTTELRS
jgi:hypothetical protein